MATFSVRIIPASAAETPRARSCCLFAAGTAASYRYVPDDLAGIRAERSSSDGDNEESY
ncbi:hypothetical protein FRACA_730006 [Frankia canadensis]|uniref:Uncharacterized protein n=1 Tax=Frankia canadensis TaxID=1836972 RepID=A0A2I2L0Y4_9ACTN|nr:hypothetical protein FRACA_730006 [Frankia canadensis]SOU58817.1 hypothetical protein FRACA_730006 [Frankia canadensis]